MSNLNYTGERTIIHSHDKPRIGPPSPPPEDDLKNTMPLSRKALVDNIRIKKQAFLEISGIDDEAIDVELGNQECVIGRTPENDLQIPLDDVSRQHARIYCRNEEYFIEDLGSTNGTYVNGITIVKCILRNNDQIEIGDAKLIFTETEMRDR